MNETHEDAQASDVGTAGSKAQDFLDANMVGVEQVLRDQMQEKYKDREVPDWAEEFMQDRLVAERRFAEAVITAFERWSSEENVIVLWDIDNTIGSYDLSSDEEVWSFRPIWHPLMQYLQTNFPSIKNGVMSNRTIVNEQLQDPKMLGPISGFIDANNIFSSRELEVSEEQQHSIEEEVLADLEEYPNQDHYQKVTLMRSLRASGLNVKLVDDNLAAATMKQDGVCAHEFMAVS